MRFWNLWSRTAKRHRFEVRSCSLIGFIDAIWFCFERSCFWFFQEAYVSVVEYFGENPKTMQPSLFFPLFGRFIKAYKVRKCCLLSNIPLIPKVLQLLISVCVTECRRHSRRLNRGRKWRAVKSKRRHRRHHRRPPARRQHKRFPTGGDIYSSSSAVFCVALNE